jgi:hypothetical protein
MIDFTLTPAQHEIVRASRLFAEQHLVAVRKQYALLPSDGISRFQSTEPTLSTATSLGLVKALVPATLGGAGGTLVESIIITE